MSNASPSLDGRAGDPRRPSVLTSALRRYALASLLALVVLALGAVVMSHRIARKEAVRDARVTADSIARDLVGPQLDLAASDTVAQDGALAEVLRHRLLDGSVTHIKIWDRSGRIVWADDRSIVGRVYVLPDAVQALFGTRKSVTELPDAEKPVEGGEEAEGDLLEVYVGAYDDAGSPFVFETYTTPQRLAENTQVIFIQFVPAGLAALLLLSVITLPLAVSLARRVDRAQRGRTEMLRHSLEAWSRERRRIAQELHDGVVQDLAAVGYSLYFLRDELPPSADQARATGTRAAELLSRAVTSLRDVVGDLLPADAGPDAGDLATALSELAAGAQDDGVEVVLDIDPLVAWDQDVRRIVIWVVREGLVNVVKHAHASVATVSVRSAGDQIEVRVADNGRGPADGPADTDRHVGLQLLRHSLDEMGGRVTTEPADGGGFVLIARLPVVLGDRPAERVGGG